MSMIDTIINEQDSEIESLRQRVAELNGSHERSVNLREKLAACKKELAACKKERDDYQQLIVDHGKVVMGLATMTQERDNAVQILAESKAWEVVALNSQHYAQHLREALEAVKLGTVFTDLRYGIITTALSLPHDTSALDEMRKDAQRYRWLRHGDNDETVIIGGDAYLPRNERLDAAIDEAMK